MYCAHSVSKRVYKSLRGKPDTLIKGEYWAIQGKEIIRNLESLYKGIKEPCSATRVNLQVALTTSKHVLYKDVVPKGYHKGE